MNPDKWENVVEEVKKIIVAKTEKEEIELFNKIIKLGLLANYLNISSALRVIMFFLKKFIEDKTREDTPKVILKDLRLIVGVENLDSVKDLLSIIKRESIWFESYRLKRAYDTGLFPYLKGIGTAVELRGVFNKELEYGENSESYNKEVRISESEPFVPVISVALTLDSGSPDRFCFQSSFAVTQWLIEELKAALYKAKLLEEHCKK